VNFDHRGPNGVVGSQGVVPATFVSISTDLTTAVDVCTPNAAGQTDRQVTGRNAPSVIGAVFNRDQFWDGRASHLFNGHDPFGGTANAAVPQSLCDGCSLASQAVGPAGSPVEMACAGRPWNGPQSLGSKLLPRSALGHQLVAIDDGVLGPWSAAPDPGLRCGDHPCTYQEMVAEAFGNMHADGAEDDFSVLFGQAVAAYEATLLPDQTPYDAFLAGDKSALSATAARGLTLFRGKGGCATCHAGAELTDATVSFAAAHGLVNRDGGDQGFHNIGVSSTMADLGRAGAGPMGVSYSVSAAPADRGAFKTPGLRNVMLTAPYFHDGSAATLDDVVALYNRGGNVANPELAKEVHPLALSVDERAALVVFLTEGLTDCRVAHERAPFDHPALALPGADPLVAVGARGTGACP
jgi:cytochrome c peroxidase